MKTRYKKAKRILTFYSNHFGYKPPYHVLVCGTFCKQALMDKINIAEQLPKYMSGEVRLLTTKCAIKECELGGPLLYGPYKVLNQFGIVNCPHSWFKGSAKCLRKTALSERSKFIIATQDEELASSVRENNIPVLHISHNSINFESPSVYSKAAAEEKTLQKLILTQEQEDSIIKLKREMGIAVEETRAKRKRKRGPNPLSCKKKRKVKSTEVIIVKDDEESKKRCRKKKKYHPVRNDIVIS